MPAKKKATDNTETNNKTTTAKTKASEAPANTKAASAKASKTPVVEAKTAAKPAAKKAPKPVLPKPVTITRLELAHEVARAVSQYMEITGQEAEAIVSEIIQSMIDSLKEGNKIEIRGFGSFRLRSRRARRGRNPKTGATVEVPSKSVVYFKLGKELKEILLEKK